MDMMRFISLAITIAVGTGTVRADTKDTPAKQLFDEGRALAKQGKFDDACDRFERSLALDPETGTEVNLADCFEHVGKLARAWNLFDDAANASDRAGNAVRAKFARDRANAIAGKLALVVVRVADPKLAGLSVAIRGQTIAKLDAELRQRVEPGDIAIVASAPGHASYQTTVHAVAGATANVDVPVLQPVAATPPQTTATTTTTTTPAATATAPATTPPAASATATAQVATERRARGRVRVAWILGSASIVVGASGLATVLVAKGYYDSDVKSHDIADANRQVRNADIATGLGVGAAVLAAASAIVYFTAPHERVVIAPVAAPGTIGATLAAHF